MLVDLSPSQVMALANIVLENMRHPAAAAVHIDIVRQVETTPEDLLRLLVDVGAGIPIRSGESVACVLQLRYAMVGGHMRCRLFTAKTPTMTFAKCGDLVFTVEEWGRVHAVLSPVVQFLPEESL